MRMGMITRTSTSLLNGVSGKQCPYMRGFRQGNPLYPLTFLVARDLLQTLFNRELHHQGILPPIGNPTTPDFLVVRYVNDTMLIMQA